MHNTDHLAKKSKLLRLNAQNLAEGMKLGNFRSLFRGQGIEFSGVRDYVRGDDVRSIDWNVTARMARPFVKVFEEERELQIFLVVDSSLSMKTGSRKRSKLECACEAASLITLASEINSSPVGMVLFDGATSFSCVPRTGREQIMHILNRLDKSDDKDSDSRQGHSQGHSQEILESSQKGSALGQAISVASRMLNKRSLVFILSDFLVAPELYQKQLGILSQKNDVIAIRLTGDSDKSLPKFGTVPFMDVESGETLRLPTGSRRFEKEWAADYQRREKIWHDFCIKHNIRPVLMKSTDDEFHVLQTLFSQKLTGTKNTGRSL
ncbi:MAG: DUF58 domain-containing protein [Treponema sp.]|nr:DUF58 domain-containing protein [Treponema sp.]